MEGISYGSNLPFNANNFEINNIKNYEDRMNINSLDGGENLADRQESFEDQYARQDNDDTEGDMISDGEQTIDAAPDKTPLEMAVATRRWQ